MLLLLLLLHTISAACWSACPCRLVGLQLLLVLPGGGHCIFGQLLERDGAALGIVQVLAACMSGGSGRCTHSSNAAGVARAFCMHASTHTVARIRRGSRPNLTCRRASAGHQAGGIVETDAIGIKRTAIARHLLSQRSVQGRQAPRAVRARCCRCRGMLLWRIVHQRLHNISNPNVAVVIRLQHVRVDCMCRWVESSSWCVQ